MPATDIWQRACRQQKIFIIIVVIKVLVFFLVVVVVVVVVVVIVIIVPAGVLPWTVYRRAGTQRKVSRTAKALCASAGGRPAPGFAPAVA